MTHVPRTIGLILAGGRARRMQGRDKALLHLRGEPLLTHLIRNLRPQTDALALSSNAAAGTYSRYDFPVLPDCLPGFLGPLAGIHAGLNQYPLDYLVTVAVDLPFLPKDLVARLRTGLSEKPCTYVSDGARHALALMWRPGMAKPVEDYLQRGERSLRGYLAVHGQPVHFNLPQDRGLFININTPEDLVLAEQDTQL